MHATRLDLRAVRWAITRDAFAEGMGAKLGSDRGVDARAWRTFAVW